MRRCGLEFRVTRHGAGPAERGGQSALRAPGGTGWLPRPGRPRRGCAQSQGTDGPGLPRAHRPFLPWGESMPLWLVSESHRTSQASTPESVTHRGSRRKPGGVGVGASVLHHLDHRASLPAGGTQASGGQRERGLGWAGEVGRGLRVPPLGPGVRGSPLVSECCILLLGLLAPHFPSLAPHLPSPQDPSAARPPSLTLCSPVPPI